MPLYKKPSPALVYDLINEANPQLPIPLSSTNSTLTSIAATTVSGRPDIDTSVRVISKGGDYIGSKTLAFRRLSLNTLFRGRVIQINKYSANQGTAGAVVFTFYNLLQQLNQQYGMNFTTDDLNDASIVRGSTQEDGYYTTTVTITAKATSVGYTGSFAFKWRGDAQDIGSMIGVTELAARSYPGGNDFAAAGRIFPIVNNMAYGMDWTAFINNGSGTWEGYPNAINSNGSGPTVNFCNRFIAELNRLYGTTLNPGYDPAGAYAYRSWNPRVVDLSTQAGRDSAPEANAEYFNRVMIMTVPTLDQPTLGSGFGTHYIHYNV